MRPVERVLDGAARGRRQRIVAAAPPFRCVVETSVNETIVRPVGELDLATSAEFEAVLERVAEQHVIVDLRELSFMGSTGIAALLRGIECVDRAGGTIELVPGRPGVQRVFELTGLSERLPFAPLALG